MKTPRRLLAAALVALAVVSAASAAADAEAEKKKKEEILRQLQQATLALQEEVASRAQAAPKQAASDGRVTVPPEVSRAAAAMGQATRTWADRVMISFNSGQGITLNQVRRDADRLASATEAAMAFSLDAAAAETALRTAGSTSVSLSTKATLRACVEALASAKANLQAALNAMSTAAPQPTPLSVAPGPVLLAPSGMIVTSFEKDFGIFRVKLENGTASLANTAATLAGTLAIWPRAVPALKMTVRNANATLTKESAGPPEVWKALKGTGALVLSAGSVTLEISDATFEQKTNEKIDFTGSDTAVLDCRHQAVSGSQLSGDEIVLKGSLRCGAHTLTLSTLRVGPNGISGNGKLDALGHAFDMAYSAAAQHLQAKGVWNASSRGWLGVPGVGGAEYRVTSPIVTIKLLGVDRSTSLLVDDIQTRTTAKKPDGNPLAQAGTGQREFPLNQPGDLSLPLPSLPDPPDLLRSARETCRSAVPGVSDKLIGIARETAENTRKKSLEACDAANPAPPPSPKFPGRISVNVTVLVS